MATLSRVPRRKTPRGFTLLELTSVLAVISILISLAVPTYRVYLDRARATEAAVNLETIAYLQQVTILERGRPIACPANPREVPAPLALFEAMPEWEELGFEPEGKMRFQYRVETKGDAFVVYATADLDQDGERSEYRYDGDTMALSVTKPGE